MSRGRLLSDDLLLHDPLPRAVHPMDSSGVLLSLMELAQNARNDSSPDDPLHGIISRGVLRSLLSALHFRDVSSVRHCRRVAMLAAGLGQYLGWDGRHLKVLEVAALLHDIGKIGVPDNILFKPGKLSPDETELMALHNNVALDVLQACHVDKDVLEIVVQSHSTHDGKQSSPYELNLGSRIVAVADAYDSLANDQVYRPASAHPEIMKILMDAAGSQFDGNVVCAMSRWVETEGIPFSRPTGDMGLAATLPGPTHPEETLEATSLGNVFSYLYMLESLYDGFFVVDADLQFSVWSGGLEKLLGRPSRELLGQRWSSRLIQYCDRDQKPLSDHECPLNRVIALGRPVTCPLHMIRSDGRAVEVELQSVPLLDRQGGLRGAVEIFRDLSRSSRRPNEFRELKLAASRDALTSVLNRGELETQLALLVGEFSRRSDAEPFSVIFLDVDYFKNINDSYGHAVGDQVLIDISRLIQEETYSGELVGRFGGEEFVILCPGTDLEQAVRRAERLRSMLPKSPIGGLDRLKVTASFGVTQSEPGDSVESILRRADKALYMAKGSGRNRTNSLTNAEMLGSQNDDLPDEDADPYVYTTSFPACIAADLIVYKLGGFVTDFAARLTEATPNRAIIRLGARGLLPFWGGSDDRRPVEVVIEFDNTSGEVRRSLTKTVTIKTSIRPLGWPKSPEIFQRRAKSIVKSLRGYFVSNDLT